MAARHIDNKQPAKAPRRPARKSLRLGVVHNATLIEERLLRRPEKITVGISYRNTMVLLESELGQSFTIAEPRRDGWVLHFNKAMSGRVSVGGSTRTLRSLRKSGEAAEKNGIWSIAIDERSRGKVTIGQTTMLFHFVTPPPIKPRPALPLSLRGGFGGFLQNAAQLSRGFSLILMLSLIVQVGFVTYLVLEVPPPPRPAGVSDLPDEIRMILTEGSPEELEVAIDQPDQVDVAEPVELAERAIEDTPEPDTSNEPRPSDRDPEPTVADNRPSSREDQLALARTHARENSALGALYNSDNGVGDSLDSVLNLSDRRVNDVMARLHTGGDHVLTAELGRPDPSSEDPTIQTGPSLVPTTTIDRPVDNPDRPDDRVRVRPRIRERDPRTRVPLPGEYASYLSGAISGRTRQLRSCYETALRGDPSLRGRVRLQFRLQADGTVANVELRDNELNTQFEGCALRRVARWTFNPPPEATPVSKTYSFESGE